MPWRGVRRPSVCLSVCKLFAQIASSTRQMAGSQPYLHTMVPGWACIQDVLKVTVEVKGHVIRALYCLNLGMSYSVIDGLVWLLYMSCNRMARFEDLKSRGQFFWKNAWCKVARESGCPSRSI